MADNLTQQDTLRSIQGKTRHINHFLVQIEENIDSDSGEIYWGGRGWWGGIVNTTTRKLSYNGIKCSKKWRYFSWCNCFAYSYKNHKQSPTQGKDIIDIRSLIASSSRSDLASRSVYQSTVCYHCSGRLVLNSFRSAGELPLKEESQFTLLQHHYSRREHADS